MNNSTPRVVKPKAHGTSLVALFPSFTSIFLICYFILCLLMNGDITPLTRRGFFCNDLSINKPYHKDTIGIKTLFIFALILPSIIIRICDKSFDRLIRKSLYQNGLIGSFAKISRKRRKVSDDIQELDVEEEELISGANVTIKRRNPIHSDSSEDNVLEAHLLNRTYDPGFDNEQAEQDKDEETGSFTRVPLDSDQEQSDSNNRPVGIPGENPQRNFSELQLFIFGLCTTMFFTGLGKITCGRLRPHFLQRCQPDVKCSQSDNANTYVEDFICTNDQLKPRDFSYITTSWPSGHASIMFYSMLYLIFYLNNVIPILVRLSSKKIRQRFNPLVLYTAYTLMVAFAGFIAITRVSDYHHHPLDVMSGSILGSVVAIASFKALSKKYSHLGSNVTNH